MSVSGRMVLLLSVLLAACAERSGGSDRQARYRAMIGRTEAALVGAFGTPTRRETVGGHEFLVYEGSDVWPARATGPWSPARPARPDRDIGFSCQATFVVVAGRVTAYDVAGSGC